MVVHVDNREHRHGHLGRLGDQHRTRLPVTKLQLLDVTVVLSKGDLGSKQHQSEEAGNCAAHETSSTMVEIQVCATLHSQSASVKPICTSSLPWAAGSPENRSRLQGKGLAIGNLLLVE